MEFEEYVARLGDLNAAGPDGFSRRTSTMSTRPITITDGDGAVAFSARTADTPEAADRHLKAGGFRRVSDWADGACTVERIPEAESKRKKRIIAASSIAAALVVIAGCGALASVKQPEPKAAVPVYVPPFTAKGTLTVESLSINRDQLNAFDKSKDNCNPAGGYKDLGVDSEVKITGNGGRVVATGRVKNGKQSPTPKNCVLTWEVTDVPAGHFSYTVSFGHRPPVELSEQKLRAGYEATIGNGN